MHDHQLPSRARQDHVQEPEPGRIGCDQACGLHHHDGIELEAGNLALKFDRANGDFAVWAYDRHKLPICPLHYSRILGDAHAELERMGDAFAGLPDWRPQIVHRAGELKAELGRLAREDAAVQQAIDAAVSQLNGDPAMLDALIRDQHWRAAHFRVAGDDINYRRFFNINDLAGLRMELPEMMLPSQRIDSCTSQSWILVPGRKRGWV